jgi:hypothetical protein
MREAGNAFAGGIEDPDIKISLLIGGEKMVNEALTQALELQAAFIAARPRKTSTKTFWRIRSPPHPKKERKAMGCWSCGEPGHFEDSCP